jgi:hypothetical protein
VLGYNLFLCENGGKPPFYGNCIYDTNNQLRGYQQGQYLDRFMMATQLEYRLTLPKRFGVVGFAGLGGVVPGSEQLRNKHFLPDIGIDLRYELSTKYHCQSSARRCPGKGQPYLGHGGWRGVLIVAGDGHRRQRYPFPSIASGATLVVRPSEKVNI